MRDNNDYYAFRIKEGLDRALTSIANMHELEEREPMPEATRLCIAYFQGQVSVYEEMQRMLKRSKE